MEADLVDLGEGANEGLKASVVDLIDRVYQSIMGPYQILIVGEPLCQPWASFPKILVEGIKADEKVKGKITIKPSSVAADVRPIAMFDVSPPKPCR